MCWDEARIVALLRGLNAAMNDELETILGFDAEPTVMPDRHIEAPALLA